MFTHFCSIIEALLLKIECEVVELVSDGEILRSVSAFSLGLSSQILEVLPRENPTAFEEHECAGS